MDIVVLSIASLLGNVGVGLTGFGMAIVYILFWQIAVLAGYDGDIKKAIFVQSLALLSAQPLLLHKAEVRKYASRKMLLYFIPVTILSTPLGQITNDRISTEMVIAVAGVLVILVAMFEVYQQKEQFSKWFCFCFLHDSSGFNQKRDASASCAIKSNGGVVRDQESTHGKKLPDLCKTTLTDVDEHLDVDFDVEMDMDKDVNVNMDVNVEESANKRDNEESLRSSKGIKVESEGNIEGDCERLEDAESMKGSPLPMAATLWTVAAGIASGFLGGLCGIRGPPLIVYFLYPPCPVIFTKTSQRATGACITTVNVVMRVGYYLVRAFIFDGDKYFNQDDWGLYVSVVVCSILGVVVGSKLFEQLKDSRATVRRILAILLLLCGVGLLLRSFAEL